MADFCYEPNLDMVERDPNDLHTRLKYKFNDVIAEPERNHSFGCVWDASSCMYECCFMVVYHLSSFFCHCWLACFYGIAIAQTGFCHVWHCTPFLKCLDLTMWPFRCCYSLMVKCVISPWCEACGYCFTAFEDNSNPSMQWAS